MEITNKMTKRRSQKERVLSRINEVGFVDNLWAVRNHILRLGAIMHRLKEEGVEFEGKFGYQLGKSVKLRKNYYYLIK